MGSDVKKTSIPFYSSFLYGDLYNSISKTRKRDTEFQANLRCFGQSKKLIDSVVKELRAHQRVLQMGITFGDEIERVAERIGAYGEFDVIDVNPLQIKHKKETMPLNRVRFLEGDATTFKAEEPYDAVICYFLLSELPIVSKMKAVNAALSAVKEGGVVIFVDTHTPIFWHPLRYVVRMYNRLWRPFAEKLWDRDIDTFANKRMDFTWRKNTCFGRMFQKVTAVRKPSKSAVSPSQTSV